MDTERVLSRFAFYGELPPADSASLRASAQGATLAPDTHFYREGDSVSQLALVGEGSLRVYKESETGRQITLYHVQGGEACLVNMLSVFLERPAAANAVVEAEVTAVVLPAGPVRSLVRRSDALRNFVFESMAQRVIEVMALTEEVAFRRMDQRLAEHLLGRFGGPGGPRPELAVTHEEIAGELGTAREVVSRLLKELERTGAVGLARGRIQLRETEVLRRAAHPTLT
jgi:CRP/FNR family transcriptional regulator, anaerobic regulatory protein